jgi:hypothetical protein
MCTQHVGHVSGIAPLDSDTRFSGALAWAVAGRDGVYRAKAALSIFNRPAPVPLAVLICFPAVPADTVRQANYCGAPNPFGNSKCP